MVFSDSLSILQALEKLKTDHPLLIRIEDMLHKIDGDQKEIVFMWVSGYVGIRGKEAADRAAKEAFDKEPTNDLMPFSDLKPLVVVALSSLARNLGECSAIRCPPALFLFVFCLKWRLAHARSVHSGATSWDDCDQMFPDKLRVSSFPDRFPHYAWTAALTAHTVFVGSRV